MKVQQPSRLTVLLAKIKYAFAVYFLFGGVPITFAVLLVRLRHLVLRSPLKFASLVAVYVAATKLYAKRYPLGVRPQNTDFFLTRALIEPLFRLNGGTSINASQPLDPDKSYVFALVPHGLLPFEWFVGLTRQPGTTPVALVASTILHIPVIRELYLLWSLEGSPENFEKILASKRNVCVVPGGTTEMMFSEPGKRVKIYTKNKGFIRMALQYGMPVVPVFAFGNHNLWHQKRVPGFIARWIKKFTGGTYPFFPWGSFGCFLPNEGTRVVHVFGDPVDMPRMDKNIPKAIVEQYHEQFYKAVADLVRRTRKEAGFSHLTVEFVGLEHLNVLPEDAAIKSSDSAMSRL